MAKQGRPRALDEAKRREVSAFVAAGASLRQAAEYVGCSIDTIKREQKRNGDFDEQMRRATARAQLAPLQAMRQAVQTHWRAAAWMLERSDPEHFGRQKEHFGAKELRALRRDLIDIFEEEIEMPTIRSRVVRRVKAAIDYAMRHAWDRQRTGSKLRGAMKYFEQRDASDLSKEGEDFGGAFSGSRFLNPIDEVEAQIQLMAGTAESRRREREANAKSQTDHRNPQTAKVVPFCLPAKQEETRFPECNGSQTTQKE